MNSQTEDLIEYKVYQTLYALDKHNKIRIWLAKIYQSSTNSIDKNIFPYVVIYYGYLDGKIQEDKLIYTKGKNIGKKNETSPLQQCELETDKKWKDKQEKDNYKLDLNECNKVYYPMLAQTFKEKNIIYPCYVQPKLDGCRCVVYYNKINNEIIYQSRTGMLFESFDHLNNDFQLLFQQYPSIILDGELYTDELPFETLAGLIKTKKKRDDTIVCKLNYYLYDIIEKEDYKIRLEKIMTLFDQISFNNIKKVDTFEINKEKEIYEYHQKFVEKNFEGLMIRQKNGHYEEKYRSNYLQKYKTFIEKEYEIIDYKEGHGRDDGCVIWICINENNVSFAVRPKGSLEYRKTLFLNGKEYIGKYLTVIYQELSENNIPRFPVGKDIRFDI